MLKVFFKGVDLCFEGLDVVVFVFQLSFELNLDVLNIKIVFLLFFFNLSFKPTNDSFLVLEHCLPRL